jgi:hypothetical protein
MKYQGTIEDIFSITGRGDVIATDIKWDPGILKNIQAISAVKIIDTGGKQSTVNIKSVEILTKKGLKDFISFFVEDEIKLDKSFIGKQIIIQA